MKDVPFEKYLNEIEPRINWLKSNDKYIEILFYLSAILEGEMDELIERHDHWVKKILLQKSINYNPIRKDGTSLGKKLAELKAFIHDSEILDLCDKVIKLRNKVVHKLFEKDFKAYDEEIKSELNSIYKLLYLLADQNAQILKKNLKSLKRQKKETGGWFGK